MSHITNGLTPLFRLTGLCAMLSASALLAAAGQGGDSQVKLSATAGKIGKDGRQVITIKMQVNKGWHAYANPVKNEDYEPNRTEILVKGAKKLEEVVVDYPPGESLKNGGDVFQVYEGKVDIKATVKRSLGDIEPLEVTVKFATCNDKLCLPPETVKLQVK